jgi:UPF0755 protein
MTIPPPPDPPSAPEDATPSARRAGRARRSRRSRRIRLAIALAALAAPFLIAGGWFWYQLDPPGGPGAAVTVRIPAGAGVSGIADRLERAGVIDSALAFRIYTRVSGSSSFQAGSYELHRDLGVRGAVDGLHRGPTQHYEKLALPPGLTFDQIAARIGRLPGRSAGRARGLATSGAIRSRFEPAGTNSLEGLTWPDTYLIEDHEDEAAILHTLVDTFDRRAVALGLESSPDPYRTVIIASLVQREAGVAGDAPLIAAVIENRLRDGMALQIDATVVYARGGGAAPLTNADFQRQSPYNTYVVTGLPPTPISTVTKLALAAALHPADVPYEYYVLTDKSGKHAFAVTFAEHEANIADARARGVIP